METELYGRGGRLRGRADVCGLYAFALTLLPQDIHFFQRRLRRRLALFPQTLFDIAKAPLELGIGSAQSRLGVHVQMATHVEDAEQHITELVREPLGTRRTRELCAQLIELLGDLVQCALRIGPFEPYCGCALTELRGARKRRQCVRHSIENAARSACALGALVSFRGFCLFRGAGDASRSEHVRMPPFHLVANAVHDLFESERSVLLCDLRMEHDLKQEVAKLFA